MDRKYSLSAFVSLSSPSPSFFFFLPPHLKKGALADMRTLGIWEPYNVKIQTLKTSIEAACMILRIDDIVSGMKKR